MEQQVSTPEEFPIQSLNSESQHRSTYDKNGMDSNNQDSGNVDMKEIPMSTESLKLLSEPSRNGDSKIISQTKKNDEERRHEDPVLSPSEGEKEDNDLNLKFHVNIENDSDGSADEDDQNNMSEDEMRTSPQDAKQAHENNEKLSIVIDGDGEDCTSSTNRKSKPSPMPPWESPEPVFHPSSPIQLNDTSLTHENIHLLEHNVSLALTEHDENNAHRILDPDSSYVSFPTSSNSRANSVASSSLYSASASTTVVNNTTSGITTARRRRPRPWDNYNAKEEAVQPSVETTPLLEQQNADSYGRSIHSVKTTKRGNVNPHNIRNHLASNNDDEMDHNIHDEESSPTLQWRKGIFTDHYGSISNNNDHHTPYFGGRSAKSKSFSREHDAPSSPFISTVTFLTVGQFALMALYSIFLHYQSHRLNHQPPYAFWFSKAGRIYNSGIGPNVPTLILFGVFHPILTLGIDSSYWGESDNQYGQEDYNHSEWELWRLLTGLFCCTSLLEFIPHIFWLTILGGVEEDRNQRRHDRNGSGSIKGSIEIGIVFFLSGVMGALAHIISTTSKGNDQFVFVTGLNGAGIVGCMAAILCRDWNTAAIIKGLKGNNGAQTHFQNSGYPKACILLELLFGLFLPYTSLVGLIYGGIMGFCCGMFFLSHDDYEFYNDYDSYSGTSSSMASEVEDMFHVNTPPRFPYEDSPPPPPSSSSKGLDTPVMRRSILTSPDDDDEYEVVHCLNESGSKGLKQRNVKSAHKENYHDRDMNMYDSKKAMRQTTSYICSQARLRFIGMTVGFLMVLFSVLYIGFGASIPKYEVLSDSFYGCKTMHGIYEYTNDASEGDDGINKQSQQNQDVQNGYSPTEGDNICAEICIPIGIYEKVISKKSDETSALSSGNCRRKGFQCQYDSSQFDAGSIEIEQDLFSKKGCTTD